MLGAFGLWITAGSSPTAPPSRRTTAPAATAAEPLPAPAVDGLAPAPPESPQAAPRSEDEPVDEAARLEWLRQREAELRAREEAWLEELGRKTDGEPVAEGAEQNE